MAKSKRKTGRKAPPKREASALVVDLPSNLRPAEGLTCGAYIRSLLMMAKPTEEILGLVGKHYPDSAAKGSDVSWNRAKLRANGKRLPETPKAERKPAKKSKGKTAKSRKAVRRKGMPEAVAVDLGPAPHEEPERAAG